MSVLEAANSPFFKTIRREFPYNEKADLKRPCMIIDNPKVLRRLVNEYVVPQGHQHSEDILNDPAMVEWVDAYAESMRKLTNPEWDAITNDPASRCFREKPKYQRLFAFQLTDVPMDTNPDDTSECSQVVSH